MSQKKERSLILITGANGQLGSELKELAPGYPFDFLFTDVDELDICNRNSIQDFFKKHKVDFCINCAAYTAVDKAEEETEKARLINAVAPMNLASVCHEKGTVFLHISTDFVFDGVAYKPLTEESAANPISVYGQTKLEGEGHVLAECPKSIILRTSWLYSSFGNNFVKTMLKLATTRSELIVIYDQIGTPTYAADLADTLLKLIQYGVGGNLEGKYGIYHYSNEGVASWYDFAMAIFEEKMISIRVNPVLTSGYPTPARRPHYTVMDKAKIKTTFGIAIPHWRESLKVCLAKLS